MVRFVSLNSVGGFYLPYLHSTPYLMLCFVDHFFLFRPTESELCFVLLSLPLFISLTASLHVFQSFCLSVRWLMHG